MLDDSHPDYWVIPYERNRMKTPMGGASARKDEDAIEAAGPSPTRFEAKDYDCGSVKSEQKGLSNALGRCVSIPVQLGEALNIVSAVAKFKPLPFPRLERKELLGMII